MSNQREYSDDTAKLLDEEISRILTEQEHRARELLSRHRRGLELIAEALLEHETIDGPEVAKLIQQGMAESGEVEPMKMNVLGGARLTPPPAPVPRSWRTSAAVSVASRCGCSAQPPVGREPGSRASATAAHRSVAVTGPRNAGCATPSDVGDDHAGHRVDPRSGRDVAVLLVAGDADGDVVGFEHAGLGDHVGARRARVGGEHGDQPRCVGPVEVGRGRAGRAAGGALRGRVATARVGARPRTRPRRRHHGEGDEQLGHVDILLHRTTCDSARDTGRHGAAGTSQLDVRPVAEPRRQRTLDEDPAGGADDQLATDRLVGHQIDRGDRRRTDRHPRGRAPARHRRARRRRR
jgi:hypothetical protein